MSHCGHVWHHLAPFLEHNMPLIMHAFSSDPSSFPTGSLQWLENYPKWQNYDESPNVNEFLKSAYTVANLL